MRKIAAATLVVFSAAVSSSMQSAIGAGAGTPQPNSGSVFAPIIMKAQSAPVFFRPPDPGVPIDTGNTSGFINVSNVSGTPLALPSLGPSQLSPAGGISPTVTGTDALQLQHRRGSLAVPDVNSRFQFPNNNHIDVVCLTALPTQHSTTGGSLSPGNYLLRPTENITVATEFGNIKIAAKSCVLLVASTRGVSLYDFHDTHSGSVVWLNGSQQLKLLPGWQLSITNDPAATLNEIDPCAYIRHSQPEAHQLNGLHTYMANFSIASALYLIKPLQHDEVLLKSAAIQHLISSAVRDLP